MKTKKEKSVKIKHCRQPATVKRIFKAGVTEHRRNAILSSSLKWVNGTEITYMFIEGAESQKKVVRQAFQIWKKLGIGISFKEVSTKEDSLVRIGFDHKEDSWSWVGREILDAAKNERTMNFGIDLVKDAEGMATALHEIGHAIGFQHEHQSPFSGIEWDKEAVYKEFSGPPNKWSKKEINSNIIDKMPANQVKGTAWDPKSIMEYEFGAGLVLEPAAYRPGIFPPGIISANDIKGVKSFYPPISKKSKLQLHKSVTINAGTGGQSDFIFTAPSTKKYTFQTVGKLDTVMVISEKTKTETYYMAGDDDSGLEKNAKIALPLVKGRNYLVNVRVMYAPADQSGSLVVS
ncbi:MAG: hypothetical protein IAF38_22250 [Bacteroidia bacterium]|nr:hypothetical protein [Bacteroidia bacterium]